MVKTLRSCAGYGTLFSPVTEWWVLVWETARTGGESVFGSQRKEANKGSKEKEERQEVMMNSKTDKIVRRTTMGATVTAAYFLLTADYGPEPNVLDPIKRAIESGEQSVKEFFFGREKGSQETKTAKLGLVEVMMAHELWSTLLTGILDKES
ncbi:hypothetical protein RJ639_010633 [Escallonia herrerae]|uniref:Uncharacterized protein n=1 Tax=Escallonia herrerae TaxID=1293975 RepID=A0AA88VNF4_9ASTE|nr:hypothetical protein RJ639_010633 [Escallonia herrerae]